MGAGRCRTARAARLVVVTPSRSMEDEPLARSLTPEGAHLHMGSGTWFQYGVGQAGTFVLVRSPQDGPPPWSQAGDVLGWAMPADPRRAARPGPRPGERRLGRGAGPGP